MASCGLLGLFGPFLGLDSPDFLLSVKVASEHVLLGNGGHPKSGTSAQPERQNRNLLKTLFLLQFFVLSKVCLQSSGSGSERNNATSCVIKTIQV